MRKVTISLPAEAYRSARIKAAQRDTSLSALVCEFLLQLGQDLNAERDGAGLKVVNPFREGARAGE